MQQLSFDLGKAKYRYCHGGSLRNKRAGRGLRQLSTKEPLHLVFKAHRAKLRQGYRGHRSFPIVNKIIEIYAKMFFIKIERLSVQNDHIHLLIRTTKRSLYQNFFRVVAGQIAQIFEREGLLKGGVTDTPGKLRAGTPNTRTKPCEVDPPQRNGTQLWKHRPFTRVVRGYKAYDTAIAYIELNEQEARGKIPYRKKRLKGLSMTEWELVWR